MLNYLKSYFLKYFKPFEQKELMSNITDYNWDNCDSSSNGEFFIIEKYASQWNLCFDIGANMGAYAQKVKEVNHNCKIVCFEPNPDLINQLKNKGFYKVEKSAVGSRNDYVNIYINQKDSGMTSMYRNYSSCIDKRVKIVTLDNYVQKNQIAYIDMIKIDTEGNEIEVLKGASKLLSLNKVGVIQFEYGGTYLDSKNRLKQAFDLLQKNYIICHLYPQGLLPVRYSTSLETYRYSNWVAISRNIFSV